VALLGAVEAVEPQALLARVVAVEVKKPLVHRAVMVK
jgi:hypothetical protein